MTNMISRNIKKKTFWAGIATIATGIASIVAGDVPGGINFIMLGVLAICGRDALTKAAP